MYKSKLLSLFVLLLLVAAVVSACGPGGGGGAAPSQQTVNIQGSEFSYAPSTITAKPGEAIKVNFKNTGSVEHTFVVKDAAVNLDFKLVAQPGQTVSGILTAPTKPGTYKIHCDVAGHTEAGMEGTLTVTAN